MVMDEIASYPVQSIKAFPAQSIIKLLVRFRLIEKNEVYWKSIKITKTVCHYIADCLC